MFQPNATKNVQLQTHVTPSGVRIPVNSEMNRNNLAAAYSADGDPSMTAVMCGFWMQAIALDESADPTVADVRTVCHTLRAEYGLERHFAMAAAMRMKSESPETFKRIAGGL